MLLLHHHFPLCHNSEMLLMHGTAQKALLMCVNEMLNLVYKDSFSFVKSTQNWNVLSCFGMTSRRCNGLVYSNCHLYFFVHNHHQLLAFVCFHCDQQVHSIVVSVVFRVFNPPFGNLIQ